MKKASAKPGKKKKSASRGSRPKATAVPKSVEAYLAAIPVPVRSKLEQMREAIRAAVPPGSMETISYGIPAFKHKRVLVWYAAFSNHCSLFPTAAVIEEFKNELKPYSTAKGTIQFPLDKQLPIPLIKKLVKARVAQPERSAR